MSVLCGFTVASVFVSSTRRADTLSMAAMWTVTAPTAAPVSRPFALSRSASRLVEAQMAHFAQCRSPRSAVCGAAGTLTRRTLHPSDKTVQHMKTVVESMCVVGSARNIVFSRFSCTNPFRYPACAPVCHQWAYKCRIRAAVRDYEAAAPSMEAVVLKNGVVDYYSVLQVQAMQNSTF